MKKFLLLFITMITLSASAQTKSELEKHFEKYYKQMTAQGDIQGIINAMTHLDVLNPTQARKDTLAYVYASEGRHLEALNTIGIDKNPTDSNINVEVKALSLKALNQPKRALEHYEVLFQRQANAYLAYEIADLKIQLNDLAGAKTAIEYGLTNATSDMKRTYYEMQTPYQVSLSAALTYLRAILIFNEDKEANTNEAVAVLNRALATDPNFNLAKISKEALQARAAKE